MNYTTRLATLNDIPAIREIYNQGIEDRVATLETRLRTDEDMKEWLINRSDQHRVLVIQDDAKIVHGWASLNVFNSRCCYSGVVDISVYVRRDMQGKGLGKILLQALIQTAKNQGFHKLVLSTFEFNEAGQRLYKSVGFRKVGTYIQQGILDGKWIDVTIMERLLQDR
ncbi:MAG: N-acetyltransferase family protein [Anaerosolibacter sp.]|jgi:phosphinothricin acetyltransferase|uniref:arsinothricin resistance N-acetyltransferase ArsN1 family A n=1 Tax=Anaerosolibacter sp. TaxID=1872527 RepID=UPI002632B4A4|nr:arsinothricin resistance N-acetyltransferase ArsN1 family A [Anaerosolibacter sp.]MDF2547816.1 N-acetyltransferase family protein [Anaerosolibacter sp.]